MKRVLCVLCFIFLTYFCQAQKVEIGAGVGVLHYKGDITPRFKPFMVRPGANIFFRYNVSRAVSFKASGMIGSFYGDDSKVNDFFQQARDFSFSSSVKEGAAQVEYNFLNFRTNQSRIVSEWTPYVFGGIAFAAIQTSSTYKNLPIWKGGANETVVLPFGIGFKKKWNNNWNWGVEFGTRKTFKDDLDSFLENPQSLSSPSHNKLLQGLVSTKDMYYYTNFSISYVFYKVTCPSPRR